MMVGKGQQHWQQHGGAVAVAVGAERGDMEAPAGRENKDIAAANLEEEWATTGPYALLADIIFCSGGESGAMLFGSMGKDPIKDGRGVKTKYLLDFTFCNCATILFLTCKPISSFVMMRYFYLYGDSMWLKETSSYKYNINTLCLHFQASNISCLNPVHRYVGIIAGLNYMPASYLRYLTSDFLIFLTFVIRSAKQDDIYGASNIILPCPGT
jgi:hypothetical protein